VMFGGVTNKAVASVAKLAKYELIALSILASLVILFGLWPHLLLNMIEPTAQNLVSHIMVNS